MASLELQSPSENQSVTHGHGDAAGDKFTAVPLEEGQSVKKKKAPRRILHFSDGILEEYSTDEDDLPPPPPPPVDPKTLKWLPWCWFYASTAAYKAYLGADFCGEKLAWFFGITTPKYQSAIDEYYRRKEEEEKDREEEEKRLSMAPSMTTVNTELGDSAIDVRVVQDSQVLVGDEVQKY